MSLEVFWGFFITLFGLCLGSFSNVLIYRLPIGKSIVRPRSRCPNCEKPITSYDNIPVFSYLFLLGKCRNCKKQISWRYPLVEFLTGALFLATYLKFGLTATFAEYAIFIWAGIVVSFIDLDHQILPDVFTLGGIIVGLAGSFLNPERHLTDSLLGILAGGGFLWAVAFIYSAIRKEEGMGGGDIKLLAWIGSVLGWRSIVFTILVSSITGSIVGLAYARITRQKSRLKTVIPFGPFLVFAAILYIFAGEIVMNAYFSAFFPIFN